MVENILARRRERATQARVCTSSQFNTTGCLMRVEQVSGDFLATETTWHFPFGASSHVVLDLHGKVDSLHAVGTRSLVMPTGGAAALADYCLSAAAVWTGVERIVAVIVHMSLDVRSWTGPLAELYVVRTFDFQSVQLGAHFHNANEPAHAPVPTGTELCAAQRARCTTSRPASCFCQRLGEAILTEGVATGLGRQRFVVGGLANSA